MKLSKQLFAAFLTVAIVPLVVVAFYLFASNLILAFNLYEQNLQSSAEIQADLLEENINRLMARAGRFASSRAVKAACVSGTTESLNTEDLSKDILSFTDETLDNVAVFALADVNGTLLYSSGSSGDTAALTAIMPELTQERIQEQEVREVPLGERGGSLLIITPVKENMQTVGRFLVVCRTDYFLRTISSHKQMEATNALIYCKDHRETVVSKLDAPSAIPELDKKLSNSVKGSVLCRMGEASELVYYRTISKTPWVLAGTISTGQIFSQVRGYGVINIAVLLVVLLVVLYLSGRQSIRMLRPLNILLDAVEHFFVSGAKSFPKLDLDPGTEIAYLAEKFAGISKEVSTVQGRLRESTYLYNTLLEATYEFRLIIDLPADAVYCALEPVSKRLQQPEDVCAPERVLAFLTGQNELPRETMELLRSIVFGRLTDPVETEIRCDMGKHREETWYHLVAVPISGGSGNAEKVVLHFEDITQEKHEEFRLIRSSQVDPLSGLLNKAAFPLHCRMSEPGKTDALFFIDLDNFKQVNDTLGHTAGDEVLISTAQAIRKQFRDGDAIGRFGGDEFVVFAPRMARKQAEQKAAALVAALSSSRASETAHVDVTASVGVCIAQRPMELAQAIQLADDAMYRAKENGRSQYFIG